MANIEPKEFWAKLDAEGEPKVRQDLLRNAYNSDKKPLVEEWLRKKKEERQEAQKLLELAKDTHKDYRNTGIAFSITLISLSSALIVWGNNLLLSCERTTVIVQIISLCLTIISCLCLQFFNYQGYKAEARSLFGQSTIHRANKWFQYEDRAVYVAIILFLIGLTSSAITFFLTIK